MYGELLKLTVGLGSIHIRASQHDRTTRHPSGGCLRLVTDKPAGSYELITDLSQRLFRPHGDVPGS